MLPHPTCSLPLPLQEGDSNGLSHAHSIDSGCDSSDCSLCRGVARLRHSEGGGLPPRPAASPTRKRSRDHLPAEGTAAVFGGDRMSRVNSAASLAAASSASPGRAEPLAATSIWDYPQLEPSPAAALLALSCEQQPRERPHAPPSPSASSGSAGSAGCPSTAACPSGTASDAAAAAQWQWQAWQWDSQWEAQHHPVPARLQQLSTLVPPVGHSGRGCCTSDIVCALEFEPHGWLLATAGVGKQVGTAAWGAWGACTPLRPMAPGLAITVPSRTPITLEPNPSPPYTLEPNPSPP